MTIFQPAELDLDQTLEMECLDSGMVLSRKPLTAREGLPACCRDAFGERVRAAVLMEE